MSDRVRPSSRAVHNRVFTIVPSSPPQAPERPSCRSFAREEVAGWDWMPALTDRPSINSRRVNGVGRLSTATLVRASRVKILYSVAVTDPPHLRSPHPTDPPTDPPSPFGGCHRSPPRFPRFRFPVSVPVQTSMRKRYSFSVNGIPSLFLLSQTRGAPHSLFTAQTTLTIWYDCSCLERLRLLGWHN